MNKFVLLALVGVAATACTKAVEDSTNDTEDTEDTTPQFPDTGIELWGLRGTATVVAGTSWSGTNTMYDEVVTPQHDRGYSAGDELCSIDYAVVHNGSPTLTCDGCDFAFKLDYAAPGTSDVHQDSQAWCDAFYTGSSLLTDAPLFEDIGLGFHSNYNSAGPALMVYYPAYQTYPASWNAPSYATATFSSGSFEFDWPITGYYY